MKKIKEEIKESKRIYYFDILRTIACLLVIMIHVSAKYAVKDYGSLNFWTGNILDGISRIAVPLFVMISGALLLDKDYEFSVKKLTRHIIRLVIFFLFWSALYYIKFQLIDHIILKHEPFSILKFTTSFIQGYYHLWFIYLIIGLYLIVPLLRLWVKEENKKYVEYFLILSMIFTYFIPQVISIIGCYTDKLEFVKDIIENKLFIKYVGGYTAYFILGWYLHNYDFKKKYIIYIFGIFGFLLTIIGTYILSITADNPLLMYNNISINVLMQAAMIFIFIKSHYINKTKENLVVRIISRNSLGIYAIHAGFLIIVNNMTTNYGINNAIVDIAIVYSSTFVISFILAFVLSKIPLIKRMV